MSPRRACHAVLNRLLIAAAFSLCAVAFDAAAQTARHTVTDLGPFEPRGVNDVGQVAGRAFIDGRRFAVLHDGAFKTVNPPGSVSAEAWSVNNRGQLVGTVTTCDIVGGNCVNARSRAFIYRHGTFTLLGTPGGEGSTGQDINDAGLAASASSTPGPAPDRSGDSQAFAASGGRLDNIGAKLGVGGSTATAVTFERGDFTVTTPRNFSADRRRRVTLLARNVEFAPGETAQQIVVRAEDARGQAHRLPVEHVARVRGFPSFAQITVRLTDALAAGGDFQLSVTFRGATSNKATLNGKPTP